MSNAVAFRFQPFSPKQLKLLTWWMPQSPYNDWDMVIADGSIRAGKTVGMLDGFLSWSLTSFQNESFILASKSMGALKRNVLRPMFAILTTKGIGYSYNRSENYIEIGSNTYYCFGANNEASQDVLQGLTAAGGLSDEAALFPQSFLEQMQARCSVSGAKLWYNCNPENPRHHLKTELIDKNIEKHILHLHFTLEDNLTLSQSVKERYARMFSGVWYKRFILGLWVAAEGIIYDMFDDSRHIVDRLPTMTKYWVGMDYGTTNPTVFLLIGLGADECLYVVDEWRYDSVKAAKPMTDVQYSQAYRQWIATHNIAPAWIFIDPSSASFIAQLYNDKVKHLVHADNNVLDGIRRISSLLGADRLKVHRRCIGLLDEMVSYVWDPKASERGLDIPVKQNDHSADAARYVMNGIINVYKTWIREAA